MYLLCPSLLAAAPHLRRDSGTIQLFVTLLFDKREEKESQMLSLGICLLIDVVVGLQCRELTHGHYGGQNKICPLLGLLTAVFYGTQLHSPCRQEAFCPYTKLS